MGSQSHISPAESPWSSLQSYGEAWSEIVRLSPVVVALRTDAALAAFVDPLCAPPGESLRMVVEKLDAAAEGAVAATLETGWALGRTLTGRSTPLEAVLDVARAAVAPARQKLRSNVRRLGGEATPERSAAE
ncbi:MAG: hypothetical protein GX458_07330 [Phyllobacteriaceae bacterium]|nr:hypothetical protein [Phyllobacteriaceae bacterium]